MGIRMIHAGPTDLVVWVIGDPALTDPDGRGYCMTARWA